MNKSPNETQSLNNYLQNLVELWDVQAEIILGFDLDEVEIISGNQHTTIAIKELVREACSNSIRHGKATSINVNIHFNQKTMSVWLTVSDNGTGFVQGSGTGLGTQMFDDFTISWERTTFSGKTTVTAEIPFTTSLVN
jgi:diaminopimelate epimerase